MNLKPCPFCGGAAELFKDDMVCGVGCSNAQCPLATMGHFSAQQAADSWNTRAPLAAYDAEAAGDGGQGEKLKDQVVDEARRLVANIAVLLDEVPASQAKNLTTFQQCDEAIKALDAATGKAGEGGRV